MADPNVELLARVATALGDLRERVTFVGGCATALLITDPAAAHCASAASFKRLKRASRRTAGRTQGSSST